MYKPLFATVVFEILALLNPVDENPFGPVHEYCAALEFGIESERLFPEQTGVFEVISSGGQPDTFMESTLLAVAGQPFGP